MMNNNMEMFDMELGLCIQEMQIALAKQNQLMRKAISLQEQYEDIQERILNTYETGDDEEFSQLMEEVKSIKGDIIANAFTMSNLEIEINDLRAKESELTNIIQELNNNYNIIAKYASLLER